MMLEVKNLSSGYGDLTVLRDVSFTMDEGEFMGIVGANAAGKTTLARALAGVLPVTGGDILWDGQSLRGIPAHRRPEAGLMMVPEGRALFPFMTVRENLEIGATNPRGWPNFSRNLERVFDLFPILRQRADAQARMLSGGQQQMLAIGRALMGEPRLLILDEPSVGLAPVVVQEIYGLLHRVFREKTAILLIEQDVRQCLKAVDRAIVIANGRIVLSGSAAEIRDSDEIRRAYMGA
jgi:branched-chain amino acid transport system ATP-binding protein